MHIIEAKQWYHTVHLCTVWYLLIHTVGAFNLDTQNVMQKKGDPGTLFGFSVAFHQQLNPTKRNLLLVGAPRAKHQNQVNVTGVVYSCDLSATTERCQPIEFGNEFLDSKSINNQWMGVRVTSQGPGRSIMSCAHRYPRPIPDSHLLTGQCYLLGDNLQVGEEERTFRRVVCDDEHLSRRSKDHEWFGYCQQGHGASFAKDNKTLLFGAPGAYHWKGIVRMEVLDDLVIFHEDPRETGDIAEFDPRRIPLQRDSYLGFSLDSGIALMEKGELTVVSGAPRGGYSGQVAFLKADPAALRNLAVELVLSGPGLASSFGYDVTVVDLNGDGWDDLAVGAPEFFVKDGDVGGAVFIYVNTNGKSWEKIDPIPLYGHDESMFGLAVENIGDINQDGYGDIAVGAPYDGSGRVYLYCGSSDGINKTPAQVLSPGPKTVSLFGYSLSGNLDIDDNHYPDLAVGSLSDSVFVFRARPVITVSTSLKITPNQIDITRERCDEKTCEFSGEACFTYTTHPASFNHKLMLNYTFKADSDRGLRPRVVFLGSSQGKLELPEQGRQICTRNKLRLLGDIADRLHSIPVSVSVSLWNFSETASASTDVSNITPVLSIYQEKTTVSEITLINGGCGSDNICQSNLQFQYKFCSKETRNGQNVFIKSPVREDGAAVITPSDEDVALEITVMNRNGDDAHQAHSVIRLSDTLRYSSVVHGGTAEPQVSCLVNDNGTLIDCELGNPLKRDAEVTFYVILSTSRISLSTKDVNVTVQLETTSIQEIQPAQVVAKVVFELRLEIHGLAKPSQVSLGENLKGESAIKSIDEIGPSVQFEFKITNLGRPLKSSTNASLNIFWPKEDSAGKWLLYLTHVSKKGIHSEPCSPAKEVNPLRHVKGWDAPTRRRRQAEFEALTTDDFSIFPTRKYKALSCSDGLSCVEIRCPLLGLDSTAMIVLHSHLWNATVEEDYSSLNYLNIDIEAALSLTNSPENIGFKSENPRTQVKLTVFLEKKFDILTKVAWWIIFLSVIAALLLLLFFALLVWKRRSIPCLDNKKKLTDDESPKTKWTLLKD